MTEPVGDVIAELVADHRELEALFREVELQPVDAPRRRELADRLTAELVRHTASEERHLHPAMREHVPHGPALADKEAADHARSEQLLKHLEGLSADDPDFNDTVAKLKFAVAAPVREAEHDLFPALTTALPPEKLEALGRMVRRDRETASPPRSRPPRPPASRPSPGRCTAYATGAARPRAGPGDQVARPEGDS
ncbi:hemerythrin domain-containing protein [Streptomyces sp. NPDC058195]|uniref:hemerythrin domain-containing protein n=1 Tax=Streptomyces sp. NPDC058195 TaxID=3346375 RepID=UPI0036EF1B81